MLDEDTGAEPKILTTSFSDPYLLIIRNDGSLLILEADESGDLDAVALEGAVSSQKWLAGSLYHDKAGILANEQNNSSHSAKDDTFMFVLNDNGALQVRKTSFWQLLPCFRIFSPFEAIF
jgi:cleavage and polyadenylation specificity factor subunit 1